MDIIDLITELQIIKEKENELKKAKSKIEGEIEKIIGNEKQEGTKSVDIGHVKVSVQNKVTRKIISEDFDKIKRLTAWPVRVKYEIDLSEMRKLATQDTEKYKLFLSCVETKPAKASIIITEKK